MLTETGKKWRRAKVEKGVFNKDKGFIVFKNAFLTDISEQSMDYIVKIDRKSRKEKDESTLTLIINKDDNDAMAAMDADGVGKVKSFLNNLLPEVEESNLGLPQGRVKATLRKSPATYKIPAQKLGEEKDAKDIAEGVLIYDKDANVLNLCVGCTFNNEDPATAFTTPAEPVAAETEKKVAKNSKKATPKVVKVKPVIYSGNKIIETTASTTVTN